MDISKVEYPYYKNYIDLSTIREHFNQLREYKPDIIEKDDNTYINKLLFMIRLVYARDEKYQRLTDFFSEECRVKCNVKNRISPYHYFEENRENIIDNLGKEPLYKEIDNYLYRIKQCTNFPIIVALTLVHYLKPTRWLDPSAGWGDRLISAIAYGKCEYVGVDPSECMHPMYEKIISTLASEDPQKYKLIKGGFEDVKIEKDYFDLVFTSPPFFDWEDYGNEKDQSIVKYKSLKEWKDGFMYPFLQKSINTLKYKGHFALYVNDTDVKYVGDIINFMRTQRSMRFLGHIAWKGDSYPKKIMVYQKL
jgi:hypothetical protein